MNVADSRFEVSRCKCGADVVVALVALVSTPVDVQPSPEGDLQLKDIPGMPAPVAVRLSVAARFGKQGHLHTRHRCQQQRKVAA